MEHIDWEVLVNKRGTTWRKLTDDEKMQLLTQIVLKSANCRACHDQKTRTCFSR